MATYTVYMKLDIEKLCQRCCSPSAFSPSSADLITPISSSGSILYKMLAKSPPTLKVSNQIGIFLAKNGIS